MILQTYNLVIMHILHQIYVMKNNFQAMPYVCVMFECRVFAARGLTRGNWLLIIVGTLPQTVQMRMHEKWRM